MNSSAPISSAAPAAPPSRMPAEAMLALSILSIQAGAALATTLFDQIGPAGIALLKAALAALSLGLASRAWRGGALAHHARLLMAFGAMMAVMFASSYETLARLPMGVAATIGFLGPLGLAAAQARRLAHVLWTILAVGGVLLLSPEAFAASANSSLTGLCWAVLSALSWAGFVVLSQRVATAVPGLRGLAVGMAFATLALAPYAAVSGVAWHVTPEVFGYVFLVAALTTTVPLALEFSALRRISRRGYGILVSTEPAAAAVVGAVTLGQALGVAEWAGIALVCAASLGMTWSDRPR